MGKDVVWGSYVMYREKSRVRNFVLKSRAITRGWISVRMWAEVLPIRQGDSGLELGLGDAHSSKGPCAEEAVGWGFRRHGGNREGASDTRNS